MNTSRYALAPQWIVPVEPAQTVLENHVLVVDGTDIAEILPRGAFNDRSNPGTALIELPHHALLPGLINGHTHAAMSLLRGFANDLPLMDWLTNHVWPAEERWVDESFVRDGTRLAIAEMLRSGTTCFNDMYFFPETSARVVEETGIRASLGMIMIDFPTRYAGKAQEYLDKGLQLYDETRHSSLISCCFAPHAPYTVSDEPLKRIATLSDELQIPVHIHVHETEAEVEEHMTRHGTRPLERLSQLGLLGPRLMAVHMTQLMPGEITALAESGVKILHCPESNLKLASGMCPVHELLAAGCCVALGTDGAASNNDLDMIGEMHTAALLAKGVSGDATALPAHQALEMATLNGARALGLESRIGSLVAGKAADMISIDLDHVSTSPTYDPIAQIVYSASRDQVKNVWVNGRQLVADGSTLTIERSLTTANARQWGDKISSSDT